MKENLQENCVIGVHEHTSLFFGESMLSFKTTSLELTLAPECEQLQPGNENIQTLIDIESNFKKRSSFLCSVMVQ